MLTVRTLQELLDVKEPVWPLVESWIAGSSRKLEVLPAPAHEQRREALVSTQVTVRSPLGAVIYETGGILVDGGWLRVLGSGHKRLPRSAPEWNWGRSVTYSGDRPQFFLIADDVMGGFFALNGGGLGPDEGKVFYFAPDTLYWENTELGYTDFLHWCLTDDLSGYYADLRWPGWESEVAMLHGDQGISVMPFLFLAGPPLVERSRRAVPIAELYALHVEDLPQQLAEQTEKSK